MSKIRLDVDHTLIDGESLTFNAPCACNNVDGIIVYYPDADGNETSKAFRFTDAHGNDLTGLGNLFGSGVHVKVILDTVNNRAFVQNGDTNVYLEEKIGNHTHTPAAIGAFGHLSGGSSFSGDLNDFVDFGSALICSDVANRPSGTSIYGTVWNIFGNDYAGYLAQYYVNAANRRMYVRHRIDGTWNTWSELLHTGVSNLTRLVSADTTPSVNNEINWTYE